MKILVVGGTGMIGGHAALRLQRKGHRVAIAGRRPALAGTPLTDLEFLQLDYIAGDASSWEGAPLAEIAAKGELMAFEHQGFWQPMDTLRDKNYLEERWAVGDAPWKRWA